MPQTLFDIPMLLPQFLLVLVRVGGLMIAAPLLSSMSIPARVKASLSLVMAAAIFPTALRYMPVELRLDQALGVVGSELMIGLVMGLALSLVFVAAELVGLVVGQQAGIALGQVFNPMMDTQGTILGQLYFVVTTLVYLAIGGHRAMVAAFMDTYAAIAPGSFEFGPSYLELTETLLTSAFVLGIKLAGPALIALFVASLMMGFISRTIPQFNILTVGFPVRVMVALSVAAISLSLAFDLLYDAMMDSVELVRDVFGIG